MTTWNITILPITDDSGTVSDAIWLVSSETGIFGVPNGEAFPTMMNGDTIQFHAPRSPLQFLTFCYSVLWFLSETTVFSL